MNGKVAEQWDFTDSRAGLCSGEREVFVGRQLCRGPLRNRGLRADLLPRLWNHLRERGEDARALNAHLTGWCNDFVSRPARGLGGSTVDRGRDRRAIHRERIKLTEWPAMKCQEVNRTDADKNAQPHRKQAGAERS